MPPTESLCSFLDLLDRCRSEKAGRPLYTFLDEAGEEAGTLTYAGLEARARRLGAALREAVSEGERALLLFPQGLDFIVALFGCWYGGVLAVPAYPPASARGLPRLLAIAEDSRPALVLTTRALLPRLEALASRLPALRRSRWLAADDPTLADGPAGSPPPADAGTPAFLQYTSGSTAAPRGVVITHGNLLHNQEMIRAAFGQSEESVVVSWLPLYHDMGLIGGLLQPLYSGGRGILFSPVAFLKHPALWLQTISRYRATTSGGPNFAYDLCARRLGEAERAGLDLSRWTTAFNGAEPVRAETLERFAAAFAPCGFRREAFQPCYGLAEATLLVASGGPAAGPAVRAFRAADLERGWAAEAAGGKRLVGCGQPWGGQRVMVCDPETRERRPDGSVGEIWVAGPSVGRGYWGRPAETEDTFGARLADEPAAGPFLRTGDLGFFAGGQLFITGRLKDLIIVRGRNLYPQDVEITAEGSHPALRAGHAAAYAIEVDGVECLAVALELERRADAGVEEVAEAVRRAVADQHEVTVHEVVLLRYGAIPKTSSGKIQRRACREAVRRGELPVVGLSRLDGTETALEDAACGGAEPGLSPVGAYLRSTAARLLGMPTARLDPDRPLTALGLDSLSAVELKHAVASDLGAELGLSALVGGASVAGLARMIEAPPGAEEHDGAPAFPPLLPSGRRGSCALSAGQERLWFLHLVDPESPAYNLASALRLEGPLHVPALWASLGEIVRRHEALRTVYDVVDRRPMQRPLPPRALRSALADFSGLPPGRRAVEARRLGDEEARRPFDLTCGPVTRFLLLRLGLRRHSLLATVHHIAADGWSRRVLAGELSDLYAGFSAGLPSSLPELPLQYADYAAWQRQWLGSGEAADRLAAFRAAFGSGVPPLELPVDRPRTSGQTLRGALRSGAIDLAAVAAAEDLARRSGVTLFVVLLGVFQALLGRITGAEDFVVGSPAANRDRRELRDLIGFFVNLLPLRADLSGNPSFTALLERVRSTALTAYSAQDLPLERVSEGLETVFALQESRGSEPRLPGLEATLAEVHTGTAKFALTLTADRRPEGLDLHLEHSTALFDGTTAERWLGSFRHLLAAVCAAPDQPLASAPLLSAAERHQLLVEVNDTRAEAPDDGLVHQQVAAWAAATPDALALSDDSLSLTYGELNRRANRLARWLQGLGVGPEVLVGVCLERSAEQVSAQLAVFKADGVYVPLPPDLPAERLRFLMADTGIRFLIGRAGVAPDLAPVAGGARLDLDRLGWTGAAESDPESRLEPGHLAYVIYTSGSTGAPKGVGVPHAGLSNLVRWHQAAYGVTPADRASHLAGLGFDASVWEVWPYLTAGASLHLPAAEVRAEPWRLREWIRASEATVVFAPTPLAEALLAGSWPAGTRVRALLTGGDRLHHAPPPGLPFVLVNHYGPTESSVVATATRVHPEPAASKLPAIGRPIANTVVHVLDRFLEPAPLGVAGEVYIGGGGLARGYAGQPGLTAERFVPSPFAGEPGARLYRTGDQARVLANGELDFLGRVDRQVKLRGYRVEPGEIEAALRRHPGVAEAVVTACDRGAGNVVLAAFLVASGGPARPAAEELRASLRAILPEPMVPADFVWLDHLPLTANGKIDHRALPTPGGAGGSCVAPRNAVEEVLASLWSEALGAPRAGVFDDFFALGGHSLVAAELAASVRESFQVPLLLKDFLLAPTIAGTAEALLRDPALRPRVEATALALLEMSRMSDHEVEAMLQSLPARAGEV
ncbi:MAG TPA: amino acid adenylation domain-containing protein [Thermoanaerobaculia bacterium]|nr:amino acid adenylation domain-containing protein [Thermoanaerobaculia bacterium]